MSNRRDTTPSRSKQPTPTSGGDNVNKTSNTGRTNNTVIGNTPQDRAIVITDGENISLRWPIAQQPPIMVSNNELLRELHYLRRQSTYYQELKDRVGQIESSLPRTRLSGKQPFQEGSRCRDGRGHIITPRNLFASNG